VRGTLDGVEDGIGELRRVERRGIRVLNSAGSLIACDDRTALRLGRMAILTVRACTNACRPERRPSS
jgi:hypothetical protein